MKGHFFAVNYYPLSPIEQDKSILLIGNHFSYWDGFIANELNFRFLKKKFYILMLEKQLLKYSFFRQCGAFSINPGHRSAKDTISYIQSLCKESKNLITIYPQGKYQSIYDQTISFEKGIYRLLNGDANIYAYVAMIEYGDNSKPSLSIYLKRLETSSTELNKEYQRFYNQCINKQKERITE